MPDWQQINALFTAVVELEPEQRAAFLDQNCACDQLLRKEVESLIAADKRSLSLFERPAVEVAAPLLVNDQPQLTPDQRIGHYQIVSLIGRGGMGEVYLAVDQLLNRKIALKLLPADYTRDKERLRRFQQEAQAASALNHPNIITIHELREVDRHQFIATEFVEGETLRQRLKRAPLTLPETLEIAIQTASALSAAHRAGIVHRDIKPENVMLRPDGYVKVLDFGLAKLTEHYERAPDAQVADRLDISSGLVMGTVKYMSPEQTRGLSVDPRSDIFSLGVLLYEMVAGHAPFKGETARDIVKSISKDEPPKLKVYLVDAREDLQRIVNRALAKNKAKRYQTAEDLLVDLKAIRKDVERGPTFQSTTVQTVAGEAVSTNDVERRTLSTVEYVFSQITQHKTGAVFGLLALLVLVGGVAYPLKKLIGRRASSFEKINVTMLSGTGNVEQAAISPDGKFVAYATEDAAGVETLWIRNLATNTEAQIIPPTAQPDIDGLVFSRNGKYLYYGTRRGELYRIPALGGTSEKILDDANFITFSPDGRQFAFIRVDVNQGLSTLVIANADGSEQRTIATRKAPDEFSFFAGTSWSPDGKVIACVGVKASDGYERVLGINIETGEQKPLTAKKWDDLIQSVAWLPDSSGILLIARNSSISNEIWRLSYPSGDLQRVTNDLNKYQYLSLSDDSNTLLTLQIWDNVDLWIAPDADSRRATKIIPGRHDGFYGLAWAPEGRIVYTSEASGNSDIWIMNADGTNQKQLTADVHNDVCPSVTHDGRYVVFQSDRTGTDHVWRMDINGSNQMQLTFGAVERYPNCSPDSKWVVFNAFESGKGTVWKTSIEGGSPAQITDVPCFDPTVSPNGTLIACMPAASNQRLILPFQGGKPIMTLDLPVPIGQPAGRPVWTPDGQALTYTDYRGVVNFWNKPIDGSPPEQLTYFTSDQKGAPYGTLYYAWSPDGKNLAYARSERKSDMVLISDLR